MKINYEYSKKDLKRYLLNSRIMNNILLFIFGIIIYLIFLLKQYNIMYLFIFIILLIIFIYLINILYVYAYIKVNNTLNNNLCGKYTLELAPNRFSLTINKKKTDYKYNSINKIKIKRNAFVVKFKGTREYLTFEKRLFSESEYNNLIKMFNERSCK